MSQPPKFSLELNCACNGCKHKLNKTVPKFQRHIADNYGLRHSSFDLERGIVEIIGDVDASKVEELKALLQKFTKKEPSNIFCCFWGSKKKSTSSSEAHINDHQKNMSTNNNNANNNSEKVGGKDQPEANKQLEQQQEQQADANSKRKGADGEDGKGSQQGKEIELGGTSENMNQRGESGQMVLVTQHSRGEIGPVYDQMGQQPRDQTKAYYGPTDHSNMRPMSQAGQMNGGYYQQPPHVPSISPFSDDPTAEGCTII